MNKKAKRGALLFELFIALLILSVGMTSTLHIFTEALFVGRKNQERREAEREMGNLLFPWFAQPGRSTVPERGRLTIPLGEGTAPFRDWCEIHAENLKFPHHTLGGVESEEKKAEAMSRPSPYYRVHLHVSRENRTAVLDLDTVILKQGNAS